MTRNAPPLASRSSRRTTSPGLQLPADLAAQLDIWSTLNFSDMDDAFGLAGAAAAGVVGSQPFALGGGAAPGTLDDLVRLGEEELQVRFL
jgi:hypothetical protein